MSQEHTPREIDWAKIIDTVLTAPGDLSGVYDRLYNYSFLNKSLLLMQGVHEPVATKQRWQEIGRMVLEGAQPKEIIRPVFNKGLRFVPVKCIYSLGYRR